MSWQNRIEQSVKEKINIDLAVADYKKEIKAQRNEGFSSQLAVRRARPRMIKKLMIRGLTCQEAVQFLHFTEIQPYSGCGCCEYRRPRNYY